MTTPYETDGPDQGKTKKDDDSFIDIMRERFTKCSDYYSALDSEAQADVRFSLVPGNMWDEYTKAARGNRPCYEFNKLRQMIRQVTGDQRQNRPGIKIRASQDANTDLATIMQGLIRNIEAVSAADVAYDCGFELAVAGGRGAWRINKKYSDDEGFDQDIVVEEIRNPFNVFWDWAAVQFDRRDSRFAFVQDHIPRATFRDLYPDAEERNFDSSGSDEWWGDDEMRLCEYWYKDTEEKTIYMLSNGETVDAEVFDPIKDDVAQGDPQTGMPPLTIVKTRNVKSDVIYSCMVSGYEKLTEPKKWDGIYIPLVPLWGDLINVDGRDYWSGMTRFARDASTVFNYVQSSAVEMVANAPKAPLMVTPKMIEGHEEQYRNLGTSNDPVLLFNVDPTVPGSRPSRESPPEVPQAFMSLSQMATDNLKAVTGQYDASLGQHGPESSGRAIMALQKQGDVSTFSYVDNLSRALRFTGEILVDLIPKTYDSTREIQILGEDGASKYVQLNQTVTDPKTGQETILYDLSQGKYSVVVTVGPSYATQRMEAAETMMQLANNPIAGPIASYLAMKNLDVPDSDEAVAAMRQILVKQGILQPNQEEQAQQQQMAQQAPPPNPAQQAQMAELQAKLAKMQADTQLSGAKATKTATEAQVLAATLPSTIAQEHATAHHQQALAMNEMHTPLPTHAAPDPNAEVLDPIAIRRKLSLQAPFPTTQQATPIVPLSQ